MAEQLCLHLEGVTVEVSMWIFEFELLNGPPGRGGIGDMAAPIFQHPRVENTNHMTLAINNE